MRKQFHATTKQWGEKITNKSNSSAAAGIHNAVGIHHYEWVWDITIKLTSLAVNHPGDLCEKKQKEIAAN